MKAKMILTAALATFLAAAISQPAAAQAPKAKKIVMSLTEPSGGTAATIRIDKKGLVKIKALPGNVQFLLKVSGVVDGFDIPVTNAGNSFQIDVLVGGVFSTETFVFGLIDGKVSQKFLVTNGALGAGGGGTGDPVDVVGIRIRETGTGQIFGTSGITLN